MYLLNNLLQLLLALSTTALPNPPSDPYYPQGTCIDYCSSAQGCVINKCTPPKECISLYSQKLFALRFSGATFCTIYENDNCHTDGGVLRVDADYVHLNDLTSGLSWGASSLDCVRYW
jgi:hypothetical protein